jgi:hypothetical protein
MVGIRGAKRRRFQTAASRSAKRRGAGSGDLGRISGDEISYFAYRSDNADGEDESDFALTTVELGIEAIINDWVTGEVVFLYEDPTFDDADSSFDADIGTITVGDPEQFPLYATAGDPSDRIQVEGPVIKFS